MATGNSPVAKGHIPELQPSAELHEPGAEPEPGRATKEGPDP